MLSRPRLLPAPSSKIMWKGVKSRWDAALTLCGDWLTLMSGVTSAIATLFGLFLSSDQGRRFYFVTAFFALGYMTYRLIRQNQGLRAEREPKFTITCDNGSLSRSESSWDQLFKCAYLRAIVTLKGSPPIENCCAYLVRVTKDGEDRTDGESHLLPFVPGHHSDAFSKRIIPGVPFLLDVLIIPEHNFVRIPTKGGHLPLMKSSSEPTFHEFGEYVFTLVISGNNVNSSPGEIRFNWTGDWKTARLTPG